MIHDLDDEVILAENIDKLSRGSASVLIFVSEQKFRNDPSETAGETDQAIAMRGQRLHIRARVAVEALGVGFGDKLTEVLVASEITRE